MKTEGIFRVSLWDAWNSGMPVGDWHIRNAHGQKICHSIEWQDHEQKISVKERLSLLNGDSFISGSSATGKTGFEGKVLQRAGNHLLVSGKAWFASHACGVDSDSVWVDTHTFSMSFRPNCQYVGSLDGKKFLPLVRAVAEMRAEELATRIDDYKKSSWLKPEVLAFMERRLRSMEKITELHTFGNGVRGKGLVTIPV